MAETAPYDVIVVGGGVVGLFTAYTMAKNGLRTLLIEQFVLPHERGSSGGQSRIIRMFYRTPRYAVMMPEVFDAWRQLETDTGQELIRTTGMLSIQDSEKGKKMLQEISDVMKDLKMPHDMLDATALRHRFPMLRHGEDTVALYDGQAGTLIVPRINRTLLNQFLHHGGTLRDGQKVQEIVPGDVVTVVTSRGRYSGRRVVLAPGPWARDLLLPLGLDLPLKTLPGTPTYWKERIPGTYAPSSGMPILVHDLDVEDGYQFIYAFPSLEYPGMVKVATRGEPAIASAHPDDRDGQAEGRRRILRQLASYVRQHMPGLDDNPSLVESCVYTRTPDGDFIIDRHPKYSNILIGAGGSGHAFKMAPIFAKLLLEMATDSQVSYDIGFLSLARFNKLSRL